MAAESRKSLKLVHSDWSYTQEMTSPPPVLVFFLFCFKEYKAKYEYMCKQRKETPEGFCLSFY